MKRILLIFTAVILPLVVIAAGTSDEELFNQIIRAQKDKIQINNQDKSRDRNISEYQQKSTNNQTQNQNTSNKQNIEMIPLPTDKQMRYLSKDEEKAVRKLYNLPKEYKVYGHDIFGTVKKTESTTETSSVNQFIADQNVNIPDEYVLGSGDSVTLQFWGRTAKTEELILDRSGEIYSETLGKIALGGHSYAEARNIVTKMTQGMEGISSSLVISNTKTVKVLVSGAVEKPGYYIMNVFGNVTQAIVNAGGVKDFADIRRVALVRNGRTIDSVDYYKLINKGIYQPKIQKLMPNDIIFVPRSEMRVLVEGAVKTEGYFDLRGESTIREVLALVGGTTSNAVKSNIVVKRANKKDNQLTIKSVDLISGKNSGLRIEDGDKITVYALDKENIYSVKLSGNVTVPGEYEYKKGMKISDVIKNADGLLADTEMESSFIVRRDVRSSETKIVPFKLQRIFDNVNSVDNLTLQPFDEIMIVGKYRVLDNVNIEVTGEVVKPGDYPAEKNATVYDMIVKAGGFTSSSDKKSIELVNFINDRYSSEYIDINKAMSTKAPLQGFIVVHGIYESAMQDYVEISGDILNSGEFVYFRGMTLNELLSKTISQDKRNQPYTVLIYRIDSRGSDTTALGLDIRSTSDRRTDMPLKEGDKIVVKQIAKDIKRYVNIEGSIFEPGTYMFATDLSVGQLISMAGGTKDSAYVDTIEVVRKEIESGGVKQSYIKVNKDEIDSFKLIAGDRVVVRDISAYSKMEYVTLSGEFKFPGKYPIKKGEKLSSIIERAGGFTDQAYLKGTLFNRVRVRLEKQQMLNKMISNLEREILTTANMEAVTASTSMSVDSSNMMLKTKDQFIDSMRRLKADGRVVVVIEHPRLLKGSVNDIVLENGDEINVPKVPSTVVVSGSVLSPGAFVFNPKMDWKDYLRISGGLLSHADKKNVFIMKVDGTAQKVTDGAVDWSPESERWEFSYFSDKGGLNAGDTIVVPDNYNRIPWMRNIKDVTQIMMQIAVTAGVIANM